MKILTLYHGSQEIVNPPIFGKGKPNNDYGRGFYCTEDIELAKEWACPGKTDGYCNKYVLNLDGLNVMHLTEGKFNILNWLAILLDNRKFDTSSQIGTSAKEYIISNFLPDISDTDVIIGYRADDSYFSYAEDFVNNTISLRDLNRAMQLGNLGEQVVLISERSFKQIKFIGFEEVDSEEYNVKRASRDTKARNDYSEQKKNLQLLANDIFVLDIIREGITDDDPRIQSIISC